VWTEHKSRNCVRLAAADAASAAAAVTMAITITMGSSPCIGAIDACECVELCTYSSCGLGVPSRINQLDHNETVQRAVAAASGGGGGGCICIVLRCLRVDFALW
jgi:hypothetical protein